MADRLPLIFFLVICGVLFSTNLQGQDNLTNELDNYVDAKRKATQPPPAQVDSTLIIQEKVADSVLAALRDTLSALEDSVVHFAAVNDSILAIQGKIDSLQAWKESLKATGVILIDTLAFIKRTYERREEQPTNGNLSEQDWKKRYLLTNANAYKKDRELKPDLKVFGWHPYWMGTAYESYNFSLLSAVAYFSYDLNPADGTYKTIHQWETTALVDSAKNHDCKVLLSVTNFGARNNDVFLKNVTAQKKLIENLITLLRLRDADGVNIDFEGIPGNRSNDFTTFIIDLSTSLKSVDPNYTITMAVPAKDFNDVFQIQELNNYLDLYIIMGYEFYGRYSNVAGPVAPLESGSTWWEFNLNSSILEYTTAGATPSKLLLGLPYYGAEWMTRDLTVPSEVLKFISYPFYRDIRSEHGNLTCCFDEISRSKYHVYRDKANNYRQIWYDDSTSLGQKYDFILDQGLGGVGIWALGYDNGYDELWKILAEKFAVPEPDEASAGFQARPGFFRRIMMLAMRAIRNPTSLLKNPRSLIMIFGSIFGLSVAGFIMVFRYGFRFKRIISIILKSTIILFVLIFVALIFFVLKFTEVREIAYLLAGFLIGSIVFLLLSRQFLSEKDLP